MQPDSLVENFQSMQRAGEAENCRELTVRKELIIQRIYGSDVH